MKGQRLVNGGGAGGSRIAHDPDAAICKCRIQIPLPPGHRMLLDYVDCELHSEEGLILQT